MGHEPSSMEVPDRRRLTPWMASFRLLVLDFVRTYIERHGASPSYGEIAAGLDSSRNQVRWAIKSLVADKLLLQGARPRSLALPEVEDEAIRALLGLGYRVDEKARMIAEPITDPPLLPTSSLTYPESGHDEDGQNDDGQGEAGGG